MHTYLIQIKAFMLARCLSSRGWAYLISGGWYPESGLLHCTRGEKGNKDASRIMLHMAEWYIIRHRQVKSDWERGVLADCLFLFSKTKTRLGSANHVLYKAIALAEYTPMKQGSSNLEWASWEWCWADENKQLLRRIRALVQPSWDTPPVSSYNSYSGRNKVGPSLHLHFVYYTIHKRLCLGRFPRECGIIDGLATHSASQLQLYKTIFQGYRI